MFSTTSFLRTTVAALTLAAGALGTFPASAQEEFPFGFEMTLDTANQPGTKRLPTLEIGDNGEAKLDFWCKSGTGQFSVADNTVIFVPGPMEERACSPERAAIDDDLVATLSAAANWKRQNDLVLFTGAKPLRFRINTN
jgi:heat shock protein HslJ